MFDKLFGSILTGGLNMIGSAFQNDAAMDRQLQAQQFNQSSAQQSMAFSADQAAIARDFNSREAAINRQFQDNMSSTAYQRGMADMKASGLNPMLAFMKGGASTPGGATASSSGASGTSATSPTPPMPANLFQNAVSSALEAYRTEPQVQQVKQQTKTEQERTDLTNAEKLLRHEDIIQRKAQTENIHKTGDILDEQLKVQKREGTKGDIDEELYKTKFGQWMRTLGTGMRELNPFVSSAKTLNQMYRGD